MNIIKSLYSNVYTSINITKVNISMNIIKYTIYNVNIIRLYEYKKKKLNLNNIC